MKINHCTIIYNEPAENAYADELDVMDQVEFIEANLRELGIETSRRGITANFMSEIPELAEEKPELIFNLVESINNNGEFSYFIPALLNHHSIPYTGSSVEALFITTSKTLTCRMLSAAGIKNPGAVPPSQCKNLTEGNRYIIKPVWEDGSLGITAESVFVYTPDMKEKLGSYRDSHWLIQDYIDGREFNVTVLAGPDGPEVLPPAEMLFRDYGNERPKIVDFKAKWEEGSFEYNNTVRDFPGNRLDKLLMERITDTALKCWHYFGLKGYARVDMRIDSNNIPYVIEVNANPCLTPGSGVVAAVTEAGISYPSFVSRILDDINC
ncbi:MAG: ATP-grasp domain-containing protein [Bacteroidales bacterium]|nr:ATP-grasp domain-containing protein [Bacteroidales bacterium]